MITKTQYQESSNCSNLTNLTMCIPLSQLIQQACLQCKHTQRNISMEYYPNHQLVSKIDISISFMDVTSAWGTNVTSQLVYMSRGKMMGENIGQVNIKSHCPPTKIIHLYVLVVKLHHEQDILDITWRHRSSVNIKDIL